MQFDRTDEALFRSMVPYRVNGRRILEVVGYQPGGPGLYASAYVLVKSSVAGLPGSYSTHLLTCMDDGDGEIPTWVLFHGRYDIPTRILATADLLGRAGYKTS